MNKNLLLKKCLVAFALLLGLSTLSHFKANSQVLYSQNFNVNNGSFTGNFSRFTSGGLCEGAGGMRRNLFNDPSALTGEMISPSLGTSAAGPTTLSYQYKVANWSANTTGTPNPWGSFDVQYGASATGPWTTVQTINASNHTVSGTCTTRTVTFTPPAGPLFIRFSATWSSGDYYLNFDNISVNEAAGPCSTVLGGTTASTSISVCSGVNFDLSVTGATNPAQTGLSYQWESADDAGFSVNLQSLGTLSTQTTSQTAPKYYRRKITCSNGGAFDYSSALLVNMNTLLNCYCVAAQTGCSGDGILNVAVATLNNASAGCPGTNNYTYFTPGISSTTMYQGSTYTLAVSVQSDGSQHVNGWIDYNGDGILAASEAFLANSVNVGANGTSAITFTIPVGATLGLTRLRVRGGNDVGFTSSQACGTNINASTWGEIEDYDITIAPPPPCNGAPNQATVLGTNALICPGGSSTLSLSGLALEGGLSYQWEESADDLTYNPIFGATNSTYVAAPTANTYYHCIVTCDNTMQPTTSLSFLVTFDASANAGTATGPASGFTFTNLAYSTSGYLGNLQWQTSNSAGGPFTDISGATSDVLNATANAAGTFYIRVRATSATCTTFTAPIMTVISIPNDNVCSATPLSLGLNGPFTNVGAGVEVGEPTPTLGSCNGQASWCSAGGNANNSVWFTFVAPPSGRVSLHFSPGNWDSQIALWSASNCADILAGTGTLIAANDDSSSSPFHAYLAPICLTPGTTYFVQVDGYSTTTNNNFGLLLKEEANDVFVSAKAILSGAYDAGTGLMRDDLRLAGVIPVTSPGVETTSAAVLANNATPANAIVDWVLLELRNAATPSTIIASKYALLQRDGDIVNSSDGVSSVMFAGIPMGNYHLSVKHRNHIGVMTATPAALTTCQNAVIDFTNGAVYVKPLIVNTPMRLISTGLYGLWAGDANGNKNTKYNGLANDKQFVLDALGGNGLAILPSPSFPLTPYRPEDVNLDGIIRYNGLNNDRNVIASMVGVSTPNNVIYQHTPN